MSDVFRFEDKGKDFPFYRDNPKISIAKWILLLVCLPIAYISYFYISGYNETLGALLLCFLLLIPVLYVSNWNYKLLFQKPNLKDIALIIGLFIAYFIYAEIMGYILAVYGLNIPSTPNYSTYYTWESLFALIFSMMGEELFKFIPFIFLLKIFFNFTNNRKFSIVLSAILTLIIFGLVHYAPDTTLISVILIQGFGSAFMLFAYLKTKNLFVSYLCHLLTDMFVIFLALMGMFA